jgi:hypothetical protein
MKEGDDYYINDKGLYIFTESYLLKRGYCCKTGCLHCPFEFKKAIKISKGVNDSTIVTSPQNNKTEHS